MIATKYPCVITVRLTPDQAAALRALAAREERPPSALLRQLVSRGLQQRTQAEDAQDQETHEPEEVKR